MSRIPPLCHLACVIAIFNCMEAQAAQPDGGSDLFGPMVPTRRAGDLDPTSAVLQMAPNFVLWDASEKIIRRLTGLLYQIERSEENHLLLASPGQGLRGWASKGSVVPLEHAEWFFSNAIRSNLPRRQGPRRPTGGELGHSDLRTDELEEAALSDHPGRGLFREQRFRRRPVPGATLRSSPRKTRSVRDSLGFSPATGQTNPITHSACS